MKYTHVTLLVVSMVILSLGLGYYAGTLMQSSITKDCTPVINSLFPKPVEITKNANGVVRGIYGSLISVNVNDPRDYLPHADGTPQKIIPMAVNVGPDTAISSISLSAGKKETPAKLANITIGDTISFWSATNILESSEVNATHIQILK